jgi:hypothetical protein
MLRANKNADLDQKNCLFPGIFADLRFVDWDAYEICGFAICGLIIINFAICDLWSNKKNFACPPLVIYDLKKGDGGSQV